MSDLYDQWYSSGWKRLTSRLGEECWKHFQCCLQRKDAISVLEDESLFKEYMNGVIESISRRVTDEDTFWGHMLPLLSNTEKLKTMLLADFQKNDYKTAEEYLPAFKTTLNQFLNQSRREIVSADKEYSPGKVATWERLDKINRQLLKDQNRVASYQYTDVHAQHVANYIKQFHPSDRNLPRTSKKVLEYLYEFSPPISKDISDEPKITSEFTEQETRLIFPDLLPLLQQCVNERLSEEQRSIVEEFFGIKESTKSNIIELSKYKMNKALENSILEILRKCLEFKTQGFLDY